MVIMWRPTEYSAVTGKQQLRAGSHSGQGRFALHLSDAYLSRLEETRMIVVRDIFQLKFGKMKEAKDVWKEMLKLFPAEAKSRMRLLTDLTGQYYTLVMENTHKSISEWESSMAQMADPAMGALYQKFTPLVDEGRREIFTIVEM
jgi:hypothetical protein